MKQIQDIIRIIMLCILGIETESILAIDNVYMLVIIKVYISFELLMIAITNVKELIRELKK